MTIIKTATDTHMHARTHAHMDVFRSAMAFDFLIIAGLETLFAFLLILNILWKKE